MVNFPASLILFSEDADSLVVGSGHEFLPGGGVGHIDHRRNMVLMDLSGAFQVSHVERVQTVCRAGRVFVWRDKQREGLVRTGGSLLHVNHRQDCVKQEIGCPFC